MLSSKTHFLLVTKLEPEQNVISLNHIENTQLDPFRFYKQGHSLSRKIASSSAGSQNPGFPCNCANYNSHYLVTTLASLALAEAFLALLAPPILSHQGVRG